MACGGELAKVADSDRHGVRLMLVSTQGCRICVALDAVEGIFDDTTSGETNFLPLVGGGSVPIVDWGDVTGAGTGEDPRGAHQVMVLRTANGAIGLRIDACLGVRTVSLSRTPPMPTRLTDASGSPLCFLLMLDGRPHLMLEPRALVARLAREGSSAGGGDTREALAP